MSGQDDNVANQREHLILLLANVHIRRLRRPDQQAKVFSPLCLFLFVGCQVNDGFAIA